MDIVAMMLFTLLLTPFGAKYYCFESNLRLVLFKKMFFTNKACDVVLKSSKHKEIPFRNEAIFAFTLYFIWTVSSKNVVCLEKR